MPVDDPFFPTLALRIGTRAERRLNIRVHQISRNKYLSAPLTSSNRCLDLPVQSLGLTQECKQH